MKNFRLLVLVWLGLSRVSSFAQGHQGSIKGNVMDGQHKALPGATIELVSKRDTIRASADRQGAFAFYGLRLGMYIIKVSHVGLRTFEDDSLDLNESRLEIALPAVILLPEDRQQLKDVVVSGKKPLIEQKIDRTIVNVDAMITAAGSNALEALAKSPGVMIDISDNISLNGKSNVLVLIDNRPTYMSGADLAAYLRSLPAGMLDKFELLPTPPAQYDAAGGAVINIVLKKNRDAGFNGGVSLGYNQGFYGRTNDVLIFNFRRPHANVFGNMGYSLDRGYSDGTFRRYFYDAGGFLNASTWQSGGYHYTSNGWNGRLGMDYFPDPQTTLGWMLIGSTRPNSDLLTYENSQYSGIGELDSSSRGSTQGSYLSRNLSVNFNAAHTFKKSKASLTADLDWVHFSSNGRQHAPLVNYFPDGSVSSSQDYLFQTPGTVNIYSGKVDYAVPLPGGVDWTSGVKFSWVATDNALNWFDEGGGSKIQDYARSNHFNYKENINAAYINVNKQWSRWGVQGGLRAENTNAAGRQLANPSVLDSSFSRRYTNVFPATYLSYRLDSAGHHRLVLSYTRKIRRPGYQQLNPFLFYRDQYTYSAGNVDLQPYFNEYLELRYTYKQTFGITAGYGYGANEIQSLTQASGEVFISRPLNFILYQAVSLVPYVSFQPARWWDLHVNAVLLYIRNNGSAPGVTVDQQTNVHEIETSNGFRLSDKWSAELDGFFPGKQSFAQTRGGKAPYNISGGVRRTILHGQGTVNLTFNDLLGTFSKTAYQTVFIDQVSAFYTRATDTRRVWVAFSYRFGKTANARKVRHDTGGAQDEQDRAK